MFANAQWNPDRTYVEDAKNPDKILIPSSNFVLIAFGEEESVDGIPFTLLDDLPLDLGQSSATESISELVASGARFRPGSRSKLSNCIEDGLVELIQLPSFQFPVKHLAYIAASPAKVDVVLVVDHRVLDGRESEVGPHRVGGNAPES